MVNSSEVYRLIKQIPAGKVTSYKIIAKCLESKAYRAIGKILSKNPDIPNTPCHRVVKSNGKVGGYVFGTKRKIAILESESIKILDDKIINFKEICKTDFI